MISFNYWCYIWQLAFGCWRWAWRHV